MTKQKNNLGKESFATWEKPLALNPILSKMFSKGMEHNANVAVGKIT